MPSVIEAARKRETQSAIIPIIDDLPALKVMESWERVKHRKIDRPLNPNQSLAAQLEELWIDCDLNYAELADAAGVPMNAAIEQFKRLRLLGLIYPDGTVHRSAKALLNNKASAYLKSILRD